MKFSFAIVLTVVGVASNLFAETAPRIETETRDGIVYKKNGDIETHVRDDFVFVKIEPEGVTFASFGSDYDKNIGYSVMTRYKSPITFLKMSKEDGIPSVIPADEVDLALFRIYSKMNVDEILQQIKDYPEEDFNAVFLMLYSISRRVATISDKRKIMDFFLERNRLKYVPGESGAKVGEALKNCWFSFHIKENPLMVCLLDYAIEYADWPLGMSTINDLENVEIQMLQNSVYSAPGSLKSAWNNSAFPANIKILYYIYSNSVLGIEQNIKVPETVFPALKKELGETHPGIRTAEIQKSILAGDLRPEFAVELREIIDKNYEMANTIALDYARKTGAWNDVAYYAYRCLKRDVFGIQKQFFRNEARLTYFDYLEFLLEGLAKTDAQAAGTLYEFVVALPPTTRQNLWLVRAERILNGIDYDNASAQKDGAAMAKKGFYENAKLEARFRESFETRLKKMEAMRALGGASRSR